MKRCRSVCRQVELQNSRIVEVGQKLADFLGTGKHPAETGMRVPRVAAKLRLWRFLEHDDLRRSGLFGRHRRFESRAAAADHEYSNIFSSHDSSKLSLAK